MSKITNAIDRGVENTAEHIMIARTHGQSVVEGFLRTFAESILRAVVESIPEQRTGFNLDDDSVNYKWMGENDMRDQILAPLLEALGEKNK